MLSNILKHTALAAALIGGLALTASCSNDDDNWTPGPQTAEGVQGVFFPTDTETAYATGSDPEFSIKLTRLDTTTTATVAIHLVSADTTTITVPDSVTFEKGSATTLITCRAEGLPEPTKDAKGNTVNHYYAFTIEVDSAQVNPYIAGTTRLTASVFCGSLWNTVVKDAYWYFGGNSSMPYYYSDIEQYVNKNRFRIVNFMGSGVDWEFTLDPDGYYGAETEGDVSTWKGSVAFSTDHIYTEDDTWLYFLVDAETSTYGWKVPGGWPYGYACIAFYANYSYIDFSQKWFSTWAYAMLDDDNSTDDSGYFYGYWAN